MIADDGRIIVRAGNLPTDPIRLYDYDLGRLCRKFCSGGYEGAVVPVCVGIKPRGNRTVRPP
jgi:hypothetical protein